MAKKHNLGDSKLTLRKAKCETMLPAETEDFTEVVYMGGEILAEDENLVNVDRAEGQFSQDKVHHMLESIPSILEAKQHA